MQCTVKIVQHILNTLQKHRGKSGKEGQLAEHSDVGSRRLSFILWATMSFPEFTKSRKLVCII